MSEVTLVRCIGCGTPLGQEPATAAMVEHARTCPEHPLAAEVAALRDRALSAERLAAERLEVLREVEWDGSLEEFLCPVCCRTRAEHHLPDCRLSRALGRASGAGGG